MQKLISKWMQTTFLLATVVLFGASTAFAQVTAKVGEVTGRPGETASVAVSLSGVEGSAAVQSFGFSVATSGAGVTFTGVSTMGTTSGDAGFTVGANTTNGNVGGFSTGTNITASGTVVYLNFSLDAASSGTMTLAGFTVNGAAVAVDPSASFTVSNRIIAAGTASVGVGSSFMIPIDLEDALVSADGVVSFSIDLNYDPSVMSIDKTMGSNGVVNAGTLSEGATVNGNDIDADTYRIAGFTGSAITGSGTLVYVAATAAATAGMQNHTLTNVVFNGGTPVYAARSGMLTVNAVNFAPTFTAELADTSILEDSGTFTFDYDATDANGDALTYSLNGPGAIDATTGVYTLDPAGKAGAHTIEVSVTDGTNTTMTSATLTVKQVDLFEANLAGFNEVPPTQTVASGWVTMRMVAEDGALDVTFNAMNLSADMTGAHIHLGGVGQNGGVSLNLAPTGTSFTTSYDITGNTDLVNALRSGGAYVNVHTTAYPAGEIRGQVLDAGNSAPAETASIAPALVNVAGDPGDNAFSISWLPVADPDGDTVNYLMQISTDANFTNVVEFNNFGQTNGIAFTIGEAAEIYDFLADNDPGSVEIGGSQTFYHRVITTDGSLWNAGAAAATSLRRGLVTDTEGGVELPAEFALNGNYPNPFNPTTSISFDLPETADVTVQLLDLLGREVMAIPSQTMQAGAGQTVQIDASSLSSGIYLYRVIARGASETHMQVKTMTLLK